MKTYTEYITVNTKNRIELLHITPQMNSIIKKSGIKEGLVLINPMHITAAVIVNDNESGLHNDYIKFLNKLAPQEGNYQHNLTGEDNAYAHIWRQLMSHQVVMAITKGALDLGPWESIFYAEFDGQRNKRILVKVLGE
ncbi:MAG: secondary thiamine-phosphate synthase enzyme YjbQ [Nanoarchaeota archaeon]